MKQIAVFALVVLLFCRASLCAQDFNYEVISGKHFKAIATASKVFEKEFPKFNIGDFSIYYQDRHSEVELVFVPKNDRINPQVGGKTSYGQEVHYLISADFKVISSHFAK